MKRERYALNSVTLEANEKFISDCDYSIIKVLFGEQVKGELYWVSTDVAEKGHVFNLMEFFSPLQFMTNVIDVTGCVMKKGTVNTFSKKVTIIIKNQYETEK